MSPTTIDAESLEISTKLWYMYYVITTSQLAIFRALQQNGIGPALGLRQSLCAV